MSLFDRVKEIESSDFYAAIEIYKKVFPGRERVTISCLVNQIQSHTDRVLIKKKENQLVNLWSEFRSLGVNADTHLCSG